MSQLNIQMTPDFEAKLRKFMALRGLRTKSEAVRLAIDEGLTRTPLPRETNWTSLRGAGLGSGKPRFENNDELWDDRA